MPIITLTVNGAERKAEAPVDTTLLSFLRDRLGLTGTKYGCGEGQCGACTVLLQGKAVRSCLVSAASADGKKIITIEGLEKEGKLHPVQQAFLAEEAFQCAYCTPGMVMSACSLLSAKPKPTEQEIVDSMNGNICRCGTYPRIVAAIRRAIEPRQSGGLSGGGGEGINGHLVAQSLISIAPLAPFAVDTSSGDNEQAQHNVERLPHFFEVKRRDLFKLLGAGMVVGLCATPGLAQESGRTRGEAIPEDIASWLHIAEDGRTTVFTGKVEMGQNIRTSLAQHVAEELRVPLGTITMVMGDTDLVPFDAGTFGSRSTPQMGAQLRKVAASAREMLIDLAAERWKTDRASLVAANGTVSNPKTSEYLSYGELTHGQKLMKVIGAGAAMASATEWRVAGKPAAKVDGRAFVTGEHRYTSDITRPGMMYGKVLRPSGFNASLVSLETKTAEKVQGVRVVRDGDFAGVAAPDVETATNAVALLAAKWKTAPQEPTEAGLFEYFRKHPAASEGFGGRSSHETGSVSEALASSSSKTLAQTYTVAYIQHAPLEPRAAVAEWSGDKLTVWTGTQRPFGVREELASAFHLGLEKVRVIVPDTGSGYGGKHTGECAVEAARLAHAAGKPVKLVWTREEEFTWAYHRPAGVIDVKSAVRDDGAVTAWEYHNYNSGPSGIATPYNIVNQKIEFHPTKYPLRQGSYRGLAATANHFARECHMDELAHLLGIDPLQFRLKNLTDPRLRAVFEAAAARFGWGKLKPAPGHGFGIAGGVEKGGYIAACVEVAMEGGSKSADAAAGKPKIVRVVAAFECGAVINPDGLRNQVSGSIVQGLGGALFEAIHFNNERILNPHFRDYRVPRFRDTPQIEVEIIDRKDLPSAGAGETPIVGLAPAVANAIFSAGGGRLRGLPLMNG
ncbi:MAG TPA: molybdopterin cofactor-binding domain-containing protein [Candidatus Saccharimonadales bacterium]|nr:molybdopterin cofactor-binding domain-containing protein [Candidatus Saccharimonadales bacterium]